MNLSELVKVVISTLNTVEVKGKENLDALLGSINALETVVQAMEAMPKGSSAQSDDDKQEVTNG